MHSAIPRATLSVALRGQSLAARPVVPAVGARVLVPFSGQRLMGVA